MAYLLYLGNAQIKSTATELAHSSAVKQYAKRVYYYGQTQPLPVFALQSSAPPRSLSVNQVHGSFTRPIFLYSHSHRDLPLPEPGVLAKILARISPAHPAYQASFGQVQTLDHESDFASPVQAARYVECRWVGKSVQLLSRLNYAFQPETL
jgi:hypothetical protein